MSLAKNNYQMRTENTLDNCLEDALMIADSKQDARELFLYVIDYYLENKGMKLEEIR